MFTRTAEGVLPPWLASPAVHLLLFLVPPCLFADDMRGILLVCDSESCTSLQQHDFPVKRDLPDLSHLPWSAWPVN
jgi:hypothetical protein